MLRFERVIKKFKILLALSVILKLTSFIISLGDLLSQNFKNIKSGHLIDNKKKETFIINQIYDNKNIFILGCSSY